MNKPLSSYIRANRNLHIFGFNYLKTPMHIRERVAITPDLMNQAYEQLADDNAIDEIVILSTCNRTEFYVAAESCPSDAIVSWLCRYRNIKQEDLTTAIILDGDDVCRHLLRVASGLDSMVLGESQIFGQLKSAYHSANKCLAIGEQLRQLFQFSFAKIKDIRSNIPLGQEPVSMAYTATQIVKQIFERLDDKNLMLIGSGETVELVGRYLVNAGAGNITIANRTLENAERLAKNYNAKAIPLYSIQSHLDKCDIVVTATSSQLPILGKGMVEQAMKLKAGKPMLLLDMAVPRDIEPQINKLDDVYLYSVDDFKSIIERSQNNRLRAAKLAEQRIDDIIKQYHTLMLESYSMQAVVPYRNKAVATRDAELAKAMTQLKKGVMPEAVLHGLAYSLTNKLLHTPSVTVRKAGAEGRTDVVDAAREIFSYTTDRPRHSGDWSH